MNTMVLPKILIARKVTIWWPLTYLSPCELKPQPNTDARVCVSSALWSSVRDFLLREMMTSHLNCVTHREPKLCTHPGPWLRKAWEDPGLGMEVFLEGCELCVAHCLLLQERTWLEYVKVKSVCFSHATSPCCHFVLCFLDSLTYVKSLLTEPFRKNSLHRYFL